LKYGVPPLCLIYIGEKRIKFAKGYGIKVRCYWECVGGTHWELGEHNGNSLGKKGKMKIPSLTVQPKRKKLGPLECMMCPLIGCMQILFLNLNGHHPFWNVLIALPKNTLPINGRGSDWGT
jgi:hypothetical protein